VPALVSLRNRLRSLFQRDRLERELEAELASHIEMQAEENRRRGMGPDEARRAAALAFGGAASVAEECREAFGTRLLDALAQDLRFGARGLRRSPGYAATVVATLALGIGANTAVFSVVRGVLLRPLPYERGDQIVAIRQPAPLANITDLGFSIPELQDLREQSSSFDGVVEYHSMPFTLLGGPEPQRVQTGVVSANFFDVLEVRPLLGRNFRKGEDAPGADPVLLLTWEFWQRAYGGDAAVVGRKFEMNDRVHTVVGVLPPLPRYPDANDVFMPASACPFRTRPQVLESRNARMVRAFGRVKQGSSLEQAKSDVDTVMARLRAEHKDAYPRTGDAKTSLTPLRAELVSGARTTFLVLLGTVALILLIACANVANLALARLMERGRELAIRQALGAGRGRILRQLLTESTILALAGGALGLLMAALARELLVGFAARFTPRASEVRLDGAVLAFTLLLSVVTGVVAGSLPGLPRGRSLLRFLAGDGTRSTSDSRALRLRSSLVVWQFALSFVLVIGAALMLRSFKKLSEVDGGFQVDNVLTLAVNLNWSKYQTPERAPDRERIVQFYETLHDRVLALPGVVAAANAWTFPLNSGFSGSNQTFQIEGGDLDAGALPRARQVGATGDYFKAIGVPLLRGRPFTPDDRGRGRGVVIVSQGLAQRHFGSQDPIGKRLSNDRGRSWREIVGVVGDVRQSALDREPEDMLYMPFYEFPGYGSTFFVRTASNPQQLAEELRRAIHGMDSQAAVSSLQTLAQIRSDALASPRLTTVLLGLFACVAIAISAAGIGGVIAYSVSQRRQEFGIRLALGAKPSSVLGLVLRQGVLTLALGLGLGLLGALLLSRGISGLLFGVAPTDPLSFLAAALLLLTVGVLSCVVPARRAAGVDPIRALRNS
jgi:putative ABC transport system permease protein